MLYDFVKPIVNIFYPTFYTFEIEGKEKIPQDRPVVLACNHTNAFVDPIIVAMLLKQRVRFYARGDVFKKGIVSWLFNQINMSPIYRAIDGFGDAKLKNDKIFEECRIRLHNNETLLIYPEGICIQEKRLVPLKKGLGRILFHTGPETPLEKDVLVIPVGVNYSDAKKFRSKVLINIGEPFSIDSFKKEVAEKDGNLVNEFTQMLEGKMKALIVNIEHKYNDEMVEAINEIYLEQLLAEKQLDKKSMGDHFAIRNEIARIINFQTNTNPEGVQALKDKVLTYIEHIEKYKLRDHLIRPETISKGKATDFILEFLIIWIGLPIYGLGLLVNYPPYYLSKKMAANIKNNEFKASVHLNVAMFAWLIYYAIQLIVIALVFRNWLLLGVYSIAVPLLGAYVLKYYPMMKKIFGRWSLLRLVRKDRSAVEQMMMDRSEIIEHLDHLKKDFLAAQ